MTGIIKSYLHSRQPRFEESVVAPICLGELDGRIYYAFSEELAPASGGKTVTDKEHQQLLDNSLLIKQVKAEAMRRILNIAPYWRQQNALADMCLLNNKDDLTDDQIQRLDKAKQLWERIHRLRARSDEIEAHLLQGEMVDYTQDSVWKQTTELNAEQQLASAAETESEAP